MGEAQGTLLSLAEVAIALAGFSAIVVVLSEGLKVNGQRCMPISSMAW